MIHTWLVKLGVHAKWLVTVFIEGFVVNVNVMYAKDELTKKSKQLSNLNQNLEVYNVCMYVVVYVFV